MTIFLAFALGTNVRSDEPLGNSSIQTEIKLIEGLRERHLYETAERFCADRLRTMQNLEDANTPEWNRKAAFFLMEQIRIMAERARVAPNRDRQSIIAEIGELENEWTRIFGDSLESIQIRFQKSNAIALIADMLRLESTVASNPKVLRDSAVADFRISITEFEALERELEKMTRESGPRTPQERYLISLRKNVEFQRALALKGLALVYPNESPEFIDGLQQAQELFRGLGETANDAEIVWKSRLETVACCRMLGDAGRGASLLNEYLKRNPPPELREKIEVEQTRLAIASKNPAAALKIIETENMITAGPDAYLARLETYILMQAELTKSEPQRAAVFRKQAMELAREIERKQGPYWGRLAQIELAESLRGDLQIDTAESETKIEAFVQLAEDGFKRGRFDEAISNYDAAESLARASARNNRALELALSAAAVFDQRAKVANPTAAERLKIETVNRFLNAAKRYSESTDAAEAYLSGLDRALALVREGKLSLSDYIAYLSDYNEFWPHSPKAAAVALQAGQLLERSGQYKEAVDVLAKIGNRSPEAKEAIAVTLRCFRAILDETSGVSNAMEAANPEELPLFSGANKAAAWFEKRLPKDGDEQKWIDIEFEAALAAAELHLKTAGHIQKMQQQFGAGIRTKLNPEDSFKAAESLLASAMKNFPAPDPERAAYRDSLRVFAAAGLGKRDAAIAVIPKNVRETDIGPILRMLDDLCVLARSASSKAKPELAGIRLEMLKSIDPVADKLNPNESVVFRRIRAESLYDTAKPAEINQADLIFSQLIRERPDDLSVLVPFGENLASRTQKDALAAALRLWRVVKSLAPEESELWWQSNETIVRIHLRLGNKAEAKQLIELLRVLRPGMGDANREKRFNELYETAK